ncbi:MAG: chemotaxis protein CheD [Nitrospirae bacterium]|nr:chemotaxis protein CheD [Magnetococcales bacterium]HAT51331.1 chemotaxis protein CheD [Alphaproteobacteria bacterium]
MAIDESGGFVVHLDPGELYVSSRPVEIHTVLGSCVSVAIFHPGRQLGAMSHGIFPFRECDHPPLGLKVCRSMGEYVSCSLRFMLSWFGHMGIESGELEVKLFGGAMMFSLPGTPQVSSLSVGRSNVAAAREIIRDEKLRLISSDVGGSWGRKIIFHSGTGAVKLKRIHRTELEPTRVPKDLSGVRSR